MGRREAMRVAKGGGVNVGQNKNPSHLSHSQGACLVKRHQVQLCSRLQLSGIRQKYILVAQP